MSDDGIDGDYGRNNRTLNRAGNKPHAVIADGAACQRVPGSLRFLTKCCREADVPLYVINDPRVWGGNTHADLADAVRDMRKTVKARVIVSALNIKEGSMFERGRLLGQLETEAKWRAKDAGKKTQKVIKDTQEKLWREREDDWSKLSSEELKKRLIEKKVIAIEKRGKDETKKDAEDGDVFVDGLVELCARCLEMEERRRHTQKSGGEQTSVDESSSPDSGIGTASHDLDGQDKIGSK